ncbi:DUF4160 domain-containing protein [Lactobacillus reuteri]|nr:DUF4160 domain-containing protein [Limosilactobacillus reuteri]NMV52793.1 DUF4160 domain-containing protein [Limosilactobacillus reuteri]NMV56578.1 DUF4160 domain-containing protein [Limosilactobacillus reuteri]NMV66020.1 DUF4160 domain-containing protein [Limosilactobacillus reuteri]
MPNLINFLGYCIYFWSNEGNEPAHVHVAVKRPSPVSAKFWLWSPVNKIDNLNRDFFVLCHD